MLPRHFQDRGTIGCPFDIQPPNDKVREPIGCPFDIQPPVDEFLAKFLANQRKGREQGERIKQGKGRLSRITRFRRMRAMS